MDEKTNREKDSYFDTFINQNYKPHFNFNNIGASDRLTYHLLDKHNYLEVLEMFKDDENKFVQSDYKSLEKLEKYVHYLLNYARFSAKRAGCDWIFRLKETGESLGLLNLYELSLENYNDKHKKCMIGFTTCEKFRRQYYTSEAVKSLIHHIFEEMRMEKIIAHTYKDNYVSKAFLKHLSFVDKTENYHYKDKYDYFELTVNR